MTTRIDERGGQGWTGECGTARSEGADRARSSRGTSDLGPADKAVVDAKLDAAERATVLAIDGTERAALVSQLRLGMERLTIGGR